MNYTKILIDKLQDDLVIDINFEFNLLLIFKKIIVKTIKKLFLYRAKEYIENFDFILNINNYQKFFTCSNKNFLIFTLINYILCFISLNDSKTETNQIILNNYLNDISKLICEDGNNCNVNASFVRCGNNF